MEAGSLRSRDSTAGLLSLVNQSGHTEPQKVQAADAEGKYPENTPLAWKCGVEFIFFLKNAQLLGPSLFRCSMAGPSHKE